MKKIRIISALIAIFLTSLIFLPSSIAGLRTTTRINKNAVRQLLHPTFKARDIINSNSPNIIILEQAVTLSIDLDDEANYLQLDQSSNTYIDCHNSNRNLDIKIEISLYSKSSPPIQRTITVPNASLRELSIRTNNHNDTVIVHVGWGVSAIKVNLCGGRDYFDGLDSRVPLYITADNVVDELPDYITHVCHLGGIFCCF